MTNAAYKTVVNNDNDNKRKNAKDRQARSRREMIGLGIPARKSQSMKDQDKKRVLGLDLGTSAVGWCLIEENQSTPASLPQGSALERIVDMGVRVFPEGVDRSRGEKSLNQDRRLARSMRRQTYRRERRKTRLLHRLIEAGLLPDNAAAREKLWQQHNPYRLRAEALVRPLSPHELGRAIYHLGQRRGYLSNRKTGNDKSDGVVAEGISQIQTAMHAGGFASLGAYLYSLNRQSSAHQAHSKAHITRVNQPARIRQQYTSRQMFLDEFDLIWQSQKSFNCHLPHLAQRQAIWQAIFHQRPLRSQKHKVGYCEFESQRKRAQLATLAAQEFRILQLLNGLRVDESGDGERWLSQAERHCLYQQLNLTKQLKWPKVRKLLQLGEQAEFNLQRLKDQGIPGNLSAHLVANAIGKAQWKKLSLTQQEKLLFELLSIDADESLEKRLINHWQLSLDIIQKLKKACRQLPSGYLHLSHKALRQINVQLKRSYADLSAAETQLIHQRNDAQRNPLCAVQYHDALYLVGYERSNINTDKALARLPFPGKFSRQGQHAVDNHVAITDLRNPLVERTLYQVRQVVNAIIDDYGMPELIRVEMARDLKINRRQREHDQKRQRDYERSDTAARKKLSDVGIATPSQADFLKYRLWLECEGVCPYSGKTIELNHLFGDHAQFHIEHIIPYSRSLDNSPMNKTLCATEEQLFKGNRTPLEAYLEKPQQLAAIKQRISHFHASKRRRFLQESIDTQHAIQHQFNDTRYIARKAREYLSQLQCHVEPIHNGYLTAILREAWQLDGLMMQPTNTAQDNQAQHHQESSAQILKNQRQHDHRHHAVDALVIAMSSVSQVQLLNRYAASHDGYRIAFTDFPQPLASLQVQAKDAFQRMIVSHKPQRKIKGPLHDETVYGLMNKQQPDYQNIVLRKSLASLNSAKQLHDIRDDKIRHLALAHLEQHNDDFKAAFQNPKTPFGMTTKKGLFRPIRKVRMVSSRSVVPLGKNKKGKAQRHVWTRSNHHMAIYLSTDKAGKESWTAQVVSMLEAAQRHSQQQPVVNKKDHTNAKFIVALHRNDLVEIQHEGNSHIYRVEKMDQQGRISFRLHYDADIKNKKKSLRLTVNALRDKFIRALKVSVLGKPLETEI